MRIGQTSLVFFVSKILGSIMGFVATIYFARRLGAEVLGTYSLVLAAVAWIGILGKAGITGAVGKRISEGNDREEYFTAGILSLLATFAVVAILVVFFTETLQSYIGAPLVHFVLLLIFLRILQAMVKGALVGTHLVHVMGAMIPIRMLIRSVTQIGLVMLGYGLTGMLAGTAVGILLSSLIGLWFVSLPLAVPAKHHFWSLISYAKFSWLGSVESRVFGWIDVTVLGLFVTSGLIGIYSVSWTISTFFLSFSVAVSNAIFPHISDLSSSQGNQSVAPILNDALRYAGLMLIPGVVGGMILNQHILQIYGTEFQKGGSVLLILLVSVLFRSYYKQMTTTFNGLDRADITFRINGVFIVANVVLNFAFVYTFGWVGAAVATALSTGIGTALAYYYLTELVDFDVPYVGVGKQLLSATIMGLFVSGMVYLERTYSMLKHNFAEVLLLVSLGAAIYFVSLFVISSHFRTTVYSNLPQKV